MVDQGLVVAVAEAAEMAALHKEQENKLLHDNLLNPQVLILSHLNHQG
jgi:hypothetical protein